MRYPSLYPFFFAIAAASSPIACAEGEPIKLALSTPYVDGAANNAIRSECRFQTDLPQTIAEEANKRGIAVQLTNEDLTTANGRVLNLRTEYVNAVGGGRYTGKKAGRIRGELRENGQVVGDFLMERATGGGMFGFTACGALERVSKALGADVAKWLVKPVMGTRQGIR